MWTLRLVLEAALHESSLFVTLTYSPENLPSDGGLRPEHLSQFLRSLRKGIAPRKLRYFGVGEYGERTRRPHYHVCLFGAYPSDEIAQYWSHGYIHVGLVTEKSAAYTCGYMCKGLTSRNVQEGGQYSWLGDRQPEFARMSLKPGIGAPAMSKLQMLSRKEA